ncbi:MAG: hypothetical protein ABEI96_07720 [Haloarculaceae archaeon]
MSPKRTDKRPRLRSVQAFDGGFSWRAFPNERMQRTSHALATDDGVWLVDPVDAEGLDDRLSELGSVAGVVVLLDRHTRDAGVIATRHGVSVSVPTWMTGVEHKVDAPVVDVGETLGESSVEVHKLLDRPFWQEAILVDDPASILVVPEAVGTVSFFRVGTERVGVHPVLRLTPPRKLSTWMPDHLLVGHGESVHDDATTALHDALAGSRRRALQLYAKDLAAFFG